MDGGEGVAGGVVLPAENGVVAFARERLGIEPDAKQCAFLASEAKEGILNCSRQWGKSTMAAVKAVHRAMTRPGSLVVVASPTEAQSAEMVMKARGMCRDMNVRVKGEDGAAVGGAEERVEDFGIAGQAGVDTRAVVGFDADFGRGVADGGQFVSGAAADAGGGRGGVVAVEYSVRAAGVLLQGLGSGREGVGAALGSGDGTPEDFGGLSGDATEEDAAAMVPAGVHGRVCGQRDEVFDRGLVEAAFREDVADLGVGVRYGF